jgi:hypothetical protein
MDSLGLRFEVGVELSTEAFDDLLFLGAFGEVFGFERVGGVIVKLLGEDVGLTELGERLGFVLFVIESSDISEL